MKRKILTSGEDAEYVLGQLCSYLRDKNYDVTELDFGIFKNNPHDILKEFINQETIYITSAHINLTLRSSEAIVPLFKRFYPNYLSPLEIINIIKPAISIYIPHDLSAPYGEAMNECRYLDLFDYILAPKESLELQAMLGSVTKVITAGWIKHAKQNQKQNLNHIVDIENPRCTIFLGLFEHLRCKFGVDGLVEYLSPVLKPHFKIKFPTKNGVEEVESAFQRKGNVQVVPSRTNSIELIANSDIIICNGPSSIQAEAEFMGKPSICLLDNEGLESAIKREKLKNISNIYFHDYQNRAPIPDHIFSQIIRDNKLEPATPFDYRIIENLFF